MGKPTSYIGITGIFTGEITKKLIKFKPSYRKELLMIGVLVSETTLRGGVSARYPFRYPRIERIRSIFQEDERAFNVIHFHANNVANLSSHLEELARIGEPNLQGLQLNMAWPNPDVLGNFLKKYPKMQIILQINTAALNTVSNNPVELARKIRNEYDGIVDYVLIDQSMGTGKQLNQEVAISYLHELNSMQSEIGLVIAGGLNSKNLNLISEIVRLFPDISIDAESGVRDADDRFDVYEAERFIVKGLEILDVKANQLAI